MQLSEEKLSALQEALPSEMSLFTRTKGSRHGLVLKVKPACGMVLIVL